MCSICFFSIPPSKFIHSVQHYWLFAMNCSSLHLHSSTERQIQIEKPRQILIEIQKQVHVLSQTTLTICNVLIILCVVDIKFHSRSILYVHSKFFLHWKLNCGFGLWSRCLIRVRYKIRYLYVRLAANYNFHSSFSIA